MEKLKYVSMDSAGKLMLIEVDGERINISNTDCFVFEDKKSEEKERWNITHLETGMRVAVAPTKEGAIKLATTKLFARPQAIIDGRELLKRLNVQIPVNKIMETKTEVGPAQTNTEVLEQKKAAWGKLAEAVYTTELQLQAMAQKAINSIAMPQTIQEIPTAEAQLKSLSATESEIVEKRKAITNRFRDVADRLMLPEKSFAEPKQKLTNAIISLKKKNDEINNREANRQTEMRLLRERVIKHCAELDAKLKLFMNDLIDKAFVFALKQSIPIAYITPKVNEWAEAGIKKILEYKIEAVEPKPAYITMTEAQEIIKNNFNIHLIDYANTFKFHIEQKFKDYEVAFLNKEAALKKNEIEKQEATKKISDEKLNTEISASLDAGASVTPVNVVDTKALKKTYEVDMPETVDNALLLFSVFAANKERCLSKLNVKKWFSFNASQVASAIGKIKSEENGFQPAGIIFKEVSKL